LRSTLCTFLSPHDRLHARWVHSMQAEPRIGQ
jgi:hypothetical protein